MLDRLLAFSFYLLFFLTPLVWVSTSFELFEYNKMMLVYLLTSLAALFWLLKMIKTKTLILKRTPIDIPLGFFLIANILSTFFSIDPHVSLWGYYSRSNGGLLSIISYIVLYYILVSNFNSKQVLSFLKVGVLGGIVVSLYAIPEHFGTSPSCVILWGQFNNSCWVQAVGARVFATLGQPNWLAGYIGALIFPAFFFLLTAKSRNQHFFYGVTLILFYLAFTFTYSRGPTLGLIAGLVVFVGLLSLKLIKQTKTGLLSMILIFLVINLFFGSSLTTFKLLSTLTSTTRESVTTAITVGTQLENEGSESGVIRLIVWRGAWEIFKHYPLFGSGVETFAYSYYQFRPVEHNLTSEWDFLYNKAHNEYLNYLATTGAVGFISYSLLILAFIFLLGRKIIRQNVNSSANLILNSALLGSYISLLIYNFFLFSVVVTNLLFFLIPAIIFIVNEDVKQLPTPKFLRLILMNRPIYGKSLIAILIILELFLVIKLISNYQADFIYNKGTKASDNGNPGLAFNYLREAVDLNPEEPSYQNELAFAAASASTALKGTDASLSAQLRDQAELETRELLQKYPKNVSFFRTAIRTYFSLYSVDQNYLNKTLQTIDATILLAPTDPKLFYNKGLIFKQEGRTKEARENFQKAVELKSNYKEAILELKNLSN